MFEAMGPQILENPYPFYRMLHGAGSVVHNPGLFNLGAWLVGDHAMCSSGLRSKQFIKEGDRVLPREKLALIPQENTDLAERRKNSLLFRDPPVHTRLRSLVTQAFTPRTVERLRPHVAEIADRLLDEASRGGTMDLIKDFAFPLPIIVIAELLGVPAENRDQFKAWSTDLTLGLNPTATDADLQKVSKAIGAMDDYMRDVIEERRKVAKGDLISELVRAQEAGDKLSTEEMVATCRLLLTAGHETTVNLIGNGVLALLRNPDQWSRLREDPALVAGAIEELLRYDSPVQMTMRFALEETPIGAHTAKKGDLVVFLLGAANRDPKEFTDPDKLDVTRGNANAHLAFGAGIHYCLGAALARLEGDIAVRALLRKMPDLALLGGDLAWRPNPVLRGLQALRVGFRPPSR